MIKPHHIDEAYQWICKQRRNHPDNADIWHLRFHWQAERTRILKSLQRGDYFFAPLQVITQADGTIIHLWRSPDALVLKALTIAIAPLLPISRRCTHVKGHGGLKFAVRDVHQHLPYNSFVMRTDVKAFYDSIDHHLLLEKLAVYITDRFTLNLLWQSMHRCVERGGLFRDITNGIPRGCPLWALRKAIKRLNNIFNALRLDKHPDKTFIGRIEKGFDFLGYHFNRSGLRLAAKTIANAAEKLHRLYEQKQTALERATVLDEYLTRWKSWTTAGLRGLHVQFTLPSIHTKTQQSKADAGQG